MKKIKSILVFAAAMMLAVICNATVRTVDNNAGAPYNPPFNYNDLQTCINAATTVNGDTIYVMGSSTSYGNITCGKQITFIGTGFNPSLQSNKQNTNISILGDITLTGICNFIGCRLNTCAINITNIYTVFIRCEIQQKIYGAAYNINYSVYCYGCHFLSSGTDFHGSPSGYFYGTHTFNNCIINGTIAGDDVHVDHCIFLGTNSYAIAGTGAATNVITNSIFYRATPGTSCPGTWNNNTSYQCSNNAIPSGSNNQPGVNPLFVNFPPAGALFNASYDFHFQTGSPCIGSSTDLTDRGVWGGTSNYYSTTGMPGLPNVLQFTISPTNPTIPQNAALNVNIISKRIQ